MSIAATQSGSLLRLSKPSALLISEGNINIAQDDNVVDITPTSITFSGDTQIILTDSAPGRLLTIDGNVKITGDITDSNDNNLLDKIAALEARIAALEAKVK